jgi:hypothetical protein
MKLFEGLISQKNKEENRLMAAEQRQMSYGREQNLLGIGTDTAADELWMRKQEQTNDLLKWQQDMEDELERLEHNLRNEVLKNNRWWKKTELKGYDVLGQPINQPMPPLLNDKGIQMILTECKPLMSRNLFNSNLDENRILQMLKGASNSIADNLADYFDEYSSEFRNWDHILSIAKNAMIPGAFRAINGWNKKMDTTMSKFIEAKMDNIGGTVAQRKGMFGFMSGKT